MFILTFISVLLAAGLEKETYVTDHVTFGVVIDEDRVGSFTLGLFGKDVPFTVQNFIKLAIGSNGYGYNSSMFHRIIADFVVQGGDIDSGDGTGGASAFTHKLSDTFTLHHCLFTDENLNLRHTVGSLGMANSGPNTNGAQFYVTMGETSWLDGNYVVFGHVVEGMDVLEKMQSVEVDDLSHPKVLVYICETHHEHLGEPYLFRENN